VRILVAALLVAALALAGSTATASPPTAKRVRVTVVGDSVADAINYVPAARRRLARGMKVSLDLRVCRRLVQPSCAFQGSAPSTALQAVQSYGKRLGDVLVVDVGYNEGPQGFGAGIDRVMRAAKAQGARGVVWVTLRETLDLYRQTNVAIRAAARRWPTLHVADWNAFSAGHAWFVGDGLHLTPTGAVALAGFVRTYVVAAARG
jgi:hypothetical protein